MYLQQMPHCCTAKLAIAFDEMNGQGQPGAAMSNTFPESRTVVLKWVREKIIKCKRDGEAILLFNTKHDQVMINEVLLLLGAKHTPWLTKTKHLETKLRTWWFEIYTYEMPAGGLATLRKAKEVELVQAGGILNRLDVECDEQVKINGVLVVEQYDKANDMEKLL